MKTFLLCLLLFVASAASAQKTDEAKIRQLLASQSEAWNRGDAEGFMNGYWKNDSLLFIGKSGVTRGWQQTLANYKKGYPDTAAMGKLFFDVFKAERLSAKHFFVVGKWTLRRTVGDLSGHFTLLFRRLKEGWVIVADHSS